MIYDKFIVEGADMLGKTTAINKMVEDAASNGETLTVQKLGLPESRWSAGEWINWALTTDADLIDRSHISEVIYGLTIRGRSNLSPEIAALVSGILIGRGYKFLICFADSELYADILDNRYDVKREAFPKCDLGAINLAYRNLADHGNFCGYTFFTDNTWSVAFQEIESVDEYVSADPLDWNCTFLTNLDGVPKVRGSGDKYVAFSKLVTESEGLMRFLADMHSNGNGSVPTRREALRLKNSTAYIQKLALGIYRGEA